jgi:hypothetical protein
LEKLSSPPGSPEDLSHGHPDVWEEAELERDAEMGVPEELV